MPRADDQSTTSYIWAHEALELLATAYGSTIAAERVLLRALNADGIPWTWADVNPPGAPAEEIWRHLTYTLKSRLAQDDEAEFTSIAFGIVTVSGIKVERTAVEALLPAGAVLPCAETSDAATTPPASAEQVPSVLPWTIRVELPAPTMTWSSSAPQSTEKSVEAATTEQAPAQTAASQSAGSETAAPKANARVQRPKGTCKMWLKNHASQPRKDERPGEYHQRLARESGDKWTAETIANTLSRLRREAAKAALSQK